MLVIEQTLTCDICGTEMQTLKQNVRAGTAVQWINRGPNGGVTHWQDVCGDCFEPLVKAFWAIRTGRSGDEV